MSYKSPYSPTRKEWSAIVNYHQALWIAENSSRIRPEPQRKMRQRFVALWPVQYRGWLFLPSCVVRLDNLPDGNPAPEGMRPKLDAYLRDWVEQFKPTPDAAIVEYPEAIDLTPDALPERSKLVILKRSPVSTLPPRCTVINRVLWPLLSKCQMYLADPIHDNSSVIAFGPSTGMVEAFCMPTSYRHGERFR